MKTVLVIPSKDELSVWTKEFIRTQEKPVVLTEDQKFWQKIFDKCLEKVRPEKDSLLMDYSDALSRINSDETMNAEEKNLAVGAITDELEVNLGELNEQATKNVQKTARRLHNSYLKKVATAEVKDLGRMPSHISLERNYPHAV